PNKYLWFYVQNIQDRGFANCKNLEKITLCSKRLSVIGDEAFSNCINLRAVYGTAYIKTVGKRAFENCPNLKRLILSDNVAIQKD
ncbi:MAG: leucine-rich repeat domain-containing protein, partial [Clostridiales bacterium]|nr:leucine-rich repeat domain-containing protein [Clostridiales bacterium]